MTFDKTNVAALQHEMHEAIKAIAAKHGLVTGSCRVTYDVAEFKFAVTVLDNSADSQRAAFDKHCKMFGLKPEHFGAVIKTRTGDFTICGIDAKKRSRPILATRDGKTYILDDADVRKFLGCQYEWEKNPLPQVRAL